MTTRQARRRATLARHEALVWIDHEQAVIAAAAGRAHELGIEVLAREPNETEAAFDERAAEAVANEERVVVSGPAFARTRFERAYVATTHRPDRLVDVEP